MYGKLKKGIFTFLGAGIMGVSLDLFLVPAQIAAGGVGGLSTIISHLTGMDVGVLILLINIPIFVLGSLQFSRKFLFYSLLGTLSLSAATQVFAQLPGITRDMMLSSVFGGAGMGLGLGLVLRVGGTTGGTDILALFFKKHFPGFSLGQFFLLIDGAVILAAGLVFGRWDVILYSALTLFVTSRVVDAMLAGVDYASMVYIISRNAGSIAQGVFERMHRGVTGLHSVSMYTGANKCVLLCVIRKPELPKLKQVVRELDSEAFVIISDAREVLGNGFKGI